MNILIYTGPNGHTATLTTDSPASSYGIPALRIEGPGLDDLPDYGPAAVFPSGTGRLWRFASSCGSTMTPTGRTT